MPLNEKDRHVLAFAVRVGAPTIVTENLRDFPAEMLEPLGVEAVSADGFALAQVDLHPDAVRASIAAIAARRVGHPRTVVEVAETRARYLPDAMVALDHRPRRG